LIVQGCEPAEHGDYLGVDLAAGQELAVHAQERARCQEGGLAHDDGRVAASLDPHGRGSAPVPGEQVGWIGVSDLAVQQFASG
jgi:hypothetical protein